MRTDKGILVGKTVQIATDLIEWAKAFEKGDSRHVALDEKNGVRVSTVFLGIDHGWGEKPLWFETMIFGGPHNEFQDRYETWDEAIAGHERAKGMAFDLDSQHESKKENE